MPYILGRGCDGEVILEVALPIEFSTFDGSFLKKLGEVDQKNPPAKLVLTDESGAKTFVSLGKRAWKTVGKIEKLNGEGQDTLEKSY